MDRVLIVRLGALGDIVHALPVAAAIHRAFPVARIDWAVSGKHAAILELVPVIDRRIVVNGWSAIGELRRRKYDVALDVQGLIKSAALARASGAARVVGFSSPYLREPLAGLFYTESHDPTAGTTEGGRSPAAPGPHVVQLNLGLLKALGIASGEPASPPEFPIARVETAAAQAVRDRTRDRYAVLNPGAAWPNKRWPPSRLGEVARGLRDSRDLASVVMWGPGEEPLAAEVVRSAAGAATMLPATSIADVVAILRGAELMVSGDTGPMHIAAAVGTPVVGIFGPTVPARNGPWSPDDVTVSRDESCECHHRRSCRRATMCIADIGVDEVIRAIDRRLAAGRSRA